MPPTNRTLTYRQTADLLLPPDADKDTESRLRFFIDWLTTTDRPWYQPALAAYRDYLLTERTRLDPTTGAEINAALSPASATAHLATVRGRYAQLLRDSAVRDWLYRHTPPDASPADRKALVDEILVRLQNDVHPSTSMVKQITVQDEADSEHLRLTGDQVRSLLRSPGLRSLPGLRDTAMIALFACTGIREAELVMVDVRDLREALGGELALRVRDGKGGKQRLVPYGPLDWCLVYIEKWLRAAEVSYGPVFRGLYKGNKRVRPSRMSHRAVTLILDRYPITVDGTLRLVKPHDLRRTYARNAYEHGMDMARIQQNLGHTSIQTTLGYIGELSGQQRRPPDMFHMPHSAAELARGV